MHNSYFILYLFYSSGYLSPIRSALIEFPFSDKDILSIDTKILLARLDEINVLSNAKEGESTKDIVHSIFAYTFKIQISFHSK